MFIRFCLVYVRHFLNHTVVFLSFFGAPFGPTPYAVTFSTATGFFVKITRFTKKFTTSENNLLNLKQQFCLIIYLCTLSPRILNTICKFVKIDYAEG